MDFDGEKPERNARRQNLDGPKRRVSFEDLVLEVSAELAHGASHAGIERCLGSIASFFEATRAYILHLSSDHSTLSMTHYWELQSFSRVEGRPYVEKHLALSKLPSVSNRLMPQDITVYPSTSTGEGAMGMGSPASSNEIEVAIPLRKGDVSHGSLWLLMPDHGVALTAERMGQLQAVGDLIAGSFERMERLLGGPQNSPHGNISTERDLAHLYLQVAEVLLVALDRHGNVLLLNRKGCELLQYSEAELLGKNWFQTCLAPDDRADMFARFQHMLSDNHEGSIYMENRVVTKQGEIRDLAFSTSLLRDDSGKIVGALSSGEDITERKHSQAALSASEHRYQIIAEQTGQVVYDWQLESGQVHWAGAIEEVTGYPPADFHRVTFADREEMIHPDDQKAVMEALGRAAEADGRFVQEYRLRKRDGTYIFVEDRGVLLRNEQGGPIRMLGTMKDITARKLHAEALYISEEKYRSIFESFQDIFYRADIEGKLQLVSPSCFNKLGYRPEEVIGRNATEFYADDPARRQVLVQRLLAEEQVSDFELRMRTKEGKVLEVSVSAHLLRDRTGTVIGYEGVLRDISERKKMEAILRSLVKGTAARTGRQFFRSLVQSLSEGLGCRYVHVGERVGPGDRVRTLAFWNNGKFDRNIEYDLSSSECLLVTTRSMCVHAKGINEEVTTHPCFVRQGVESFIGAPLIGADDEIMGFLMIMDNQQIPDEVLGQAKSLITIAASRAAAELERMNADRELQRTCVELRATTEKLKSEHDTLTERNITLKNVLEHIEQEREGYRAEICASLEQALTPYVKKLQEGNGRLSTRDLGALTDLVGSIVGQGVDSFKANYPKLSPRETEICELIMEGHPSKDISDILGISVETIHKHREVIRRKLRIQHLDINLSTYLRSKMR